LTYNDKTEYLYYQSPLDKSFFMDEKGKNFAIRYLQDDVLILIENFKRGEQGKAALFSRKKQIDGKLYKIFASIIEEESLIDAVPESDNYLIKTIDSKCYS